MIPIASAAQAAIRAATVQDLAAMAILHAACFPRSWDESALRAFVADPASTCLVAESEARGELRGLVIARAAEDEAELITLAVAPEQRRRGVAAGLLASAAAVLKLRGGAKLFLEVEIGNQPALALYRSFGAEPVGYRRDYYENGADAAIFCLAL